MKDIKEYINESLRLNESQSVNSTDIINSLNNIKEWNNIDNVKELISEDDEKYLNDCVKIIDEVADAIKSYVEIAEEEKTNLSNLSEWLDDQIIDGLLQNICENFNEKFEDKVFDIFNAASMKVCKEIWLI